MSKAGDSQGTRGCMRIGELAAQAGTTVKAIRYCEALGLLDPPPRAPNGYRMYAPEALGQLQFIRRVKRLGLSLEEIQGLFQTAKTGQSAPLRAQVTELLAEKLADLDHQIAALESQRAVLRKRWRLAVAARAAPPCTCHGFDVRCACLPVAPEEVAVPPGA
jgi:DNA-binding transcriptional MerR regulator